MAKQQITIHDAVTGETVVRDMTEKEIENNNTTVEPPTSPEA
jgi:hypothetical protein